MPERSRPSTVALVVEQVRYQNRLFRRNPMAASFTLAFPMIFLVLFGALFDEIDVAPGVWVEAAQFYAPGLAVFAAVSATYSNIGISTAMTRDEGILKRTRGTPLPPWMEQDVKGKQLYTCVHAWPPTNRGILVMAY